VLAPAQTYASTVWPRAAGVRNVNRDPEVCRGLLIEQRWLVLP
jgi:hypothetical protein